MEDTPALATPAPGVALKRTTITRRTLRDDDVRIGIEYCGICHSDIHQARGEWGRGNFPMVPGHEIAGVVREVGRSVTKFAVGDHVGVGCFVNSCGECEYCRRGEEQFCTRGVVPTYNGRDYDGETTQGGYSRMIVVKEHFVLRMPDELGLSVAAPLMCAGITTYSPLVRWNAGPGTQVAIVGMGGLGHVAVQIAHAIGAEVTVLSHTLNKKEDGVRLGADHYYATSDPTTFTRLDGRLDLILNTVSVNLDLDAHLRMLRVDGAMVNLGIPPEHDTFHASSLVPRRRSIAGSNVGGIPETQQMLDFCARHDITARIELIGADEVNDAWDRVVKSAVRYRFVIDTATLDDV
jgi:uncharacterized zinc-type alcohol dehydrogenase-like protein